MIQWFLVYTESYATILQSNLRTFSSPQRASPPPWASGPHLPYPSSHPIQALTCSLHLFSSVQFSHSVVSDSATPMDCSPPGFPVYQQLLELTQTHVHRIGDAISSPGVPFSSCLQPFPASGSFPMSQFFSSGGQSIGVSTSVLPMNIQDWSPLGWTCWISLQSKGLSRVFSNTIVQKHQFFNTQLS